jgi:hypothetical protein
MASVVLVVDSAAPVERTLAVLTATPVAFTSTVHASSPFGRLDSQGGPPPTSAVDANSILRSRTLDRARPNCGYFAMTEVALDRFARAVTLPCPWCKFISTRVGPMCTSLRAGETSTDSVSPRGVMVTATSSGPSFGSGSVVT